MKQATTVGEMGVSIKHAYVVPPARVLVIEDNSSDVFLLERAMNKQDLRFELVHLADGAAPSPSFAGKAPMRMRRFRS